MQLEGQFAAVECPDQHYHRLNLRTVKLITKL